MKFTRQFDQMDCGPACIRMVASVYGRHSFSEEAFSGFWLNGDKGVVIAMEPQDEFFEKKAVKEKHSLLNFAR